MSNLDPRFQVAYEPDIPPSSSPSPRPGVWDKRVCVSGGVPPGDTTGRRFRVFIRLVDADYSGLHIKLQGYPGYVLGDFRKNLTYGQLYQAVSRSPHKVMVGARDFLSSLPLRTNKNEILNLGMRLESRQDNPALHPTLQDLADEIICDVREACAAFDNPALWYPGIDKEIEPVTDGFIHFVIEAIQRELIRELRTGRGNLMLPAAPLKDLPFHVQRALVERRRYRYLQYGLTKDNWKTGRWSMWDIPEDPLWKPRMRMLQEM